MDIFLPCEFSIVYALACFQVIVKNLNRRYTMHLWLCSQVLSVSHSTVNSLLLFISKQWQQLWKSCNQVPCLQWKVVLQPSLN